MNRRDCLKKIGQGAAVAAIAPAALLFAPSAKGAIVRGTTTEVMGADKWLSEVQRLMLEPRQYIYHRDATYTNG